MFIRGGFPKLAQLEHEMPKRPQGSYTRRRYRGAVRPLPWRRVRRAGGERGSAGDIGEMEKVHVPEVTCQGLCLVPSSERM